MTARLRSDKGSFVRSAKGAFETGAPIVAAGTIQVAQILGYANMPALSPTPTQCLLQITGTGLRDVFTFDFAAGTVWTDDQLAYGTYTGLISGVAWSPTSWSTVYHCDYVNNALPRVYVGGQVLDVFGDGSTWAHEFYVETQIDTDPQDMRATYNAALFPGQTMPAFVNAEEFSFTPGVAP